MAKADLKENAAQVSEISVKVKFMGDLRAVVKKRDLEMTMPQGSTVGDLLTFLADSFGDPFTSWVFSRPGKLHHYILIFLNGQNVKDVGGLGARLGDSEVEIIMLPMFEGG